MKIKKMNNLKTKFTKTLDAEYRELAIQHIRLSMVDRVKLRIQERTGQPGGIPWVDYFAISKELNPIVYLR